MVLPANRRLYVTLCDRALDETIPKRGCRGDALRTDVLFPDLLLVDGAVQLSEYFIRFVVFIYRPHNFVFLGLNYVLFQVDFSPVTQFGLRSGCQTAQDFILAGKFE